MNSAAIQSRASSSPAYFDESTIDQVLLFIESESLMLVSESHAYQPHVRAHRQRIEARHADRPIRVEHVSMEKIQSLRRDAAGKGATSDMQRTATELFADAVRCKASDIHIRVERSRTDVYYRIHSDLVRSVQHPTAWGKSLCQTIYHAMTDVSDATFEEGNRQDARIGQRQFLPEGVNGIRVATIPAVDGYLMVLRVLYDTAGQSLDLGDLGYTPVQKAHIHHMMRRPTGMYLVTGPTGSGKSTTLQRVLARLIQDTQGKKNVITVEDPPEYPIAGAIQSPVTNASSDAQRTLAFQQAIKGAMRADPDVIMVGEIRDQPSARLALEAAMTGHQVWSTLHANGAFHIIDRLLDLGLPLDMLTDPGILGGLVSQRLLKSLCSCKQRLSQVMDQRLQREPDFAQDIERMRLVFDADLELLHVAGQGCPLCQHTGVIGRQAVAEVVTPDLNMMQMIKARDTQAAIAYWKTQQQGMTLLEHTLLKVRQGLVDPFQAESTVGPLDAGQPILAAQPAGTAFIQ